jgi:hypothetical protein
MGGALVVARCNCWMSCWLIEEILLPESKRTSWSLSLRQTTVEQMRRPDDDEAWMWVRRASGDVPSTSFPGVQRERRHPPAEHWRPM